MLSVLFSQFWAAASGADFWNIYLNASIWIMINPLHIAAINNGKAYFERIKSNMCHG